MNDMDFNKLKISKATLNSLIRYKTEILIDVHEEILKNDLLLVKESLLLINDTELHYILKYHEKVVINFFYFNENNILKNYLFWLYRVYYTRGVDLDFLVIIYKTWKKCFLRYLSKVNSYELNLFYDVLIENHNKIELEALKHTRFDVNKEVETIYNLLVDNKEEEVKQIIKLSSNSLDEFIDFFSSKLVVALQKVGFMWEVSKLSVAKEHISSHIVEKLCLEKLDEFVGEESKSKIVLLTNAPNEYHSMGLKIVSKILEKKGYDVSMLKNTDSLKKDITKAIHNFDVDYIMFGISLSISLYEVVKIVESLNEDKNHKKFEIVVGGNACKLLKEPAKALKADIYLEDIHSIINFF
ncbi:MAG: cobalamin B12-binding domain-containing protein [Campylobacterota bacterium]